MKVAKLIGENIKIQENEKPSLLDKKGAIVKVLGCGLCGSDIVKFRHYLDNQEIVLGHEIVGIITELNSDTDFLIGDRIVSSHHIPCFECHYCKGGSHSMCEHFKQTNIFPGGFSEFIYLSEEHLQNVAYKVPVEFTDDEISFYEPLGCCVRSIERANLTVGENVLVIGLGSIGNIMAQGIKAYGMNTFACDLMEDRIELGNSKGVDSFNSRDIKFSEEYIKSKTKGLGVDAVFMTSGADQAIELALKTVRNGGKIIVFSSTPKNFGYSNNDVYYKELTVMGSYSPRPTDLKKSFDLLTTKQVNVEDLSTTYEFDNISDAFSDTINNKVLKAYVRIGDEQ